MMMLGADGAVDLELLHTSSDIAKINPSVARPSSACASVSSRQSTPGNIDMDLINHTAFS